MSSLRLSEERAKPGVKRQNKYEARRASTIERLNNHEDTKLQKSQAKLSAFISAICGQTFVSFVVKINLKLKRRDTL